MRFPSRLTLGARTLAPVALVLLLAGLGGGCEEKHIGRPCNLGLQADAGDTTITSPALQCPSRICILPQADKDPKGTLPLCTDTCSSDGDCDGETADKNNANDHRCRSGFTCMWPTTVGAFCCQKMCVCRDFVTPPADGKWQEPPICKDPNGGCANVK
jgi:hypothetical protein